MMKMTFVVLFSLILFPLPSIGTPAAPGLTQWQIIPDEIIHNLGTAGDPQYLPAEFFAQPFADSDELKKAIGLYYDQDYGLALEAVDGSELIARGNAEALAWRSLICYRLEEYEESLATARLALARNPHLGLAHQALGMTFNGQIHSASWTNQDSTLAHIIQTTEMAPILSSPWMVLWAEYVKKDDPEGERRALQGMIDNKVFTTGMLEYTRWVLQSVPQNALFLVNGDMDTYPMLALMQAEGLRQDITLINISMLNAVPYGKVICNRAGLIWPISDKDFQNTASIRQEDGSVLNRRDQIIKGWAQLEKIGELGRPLAWALSVPLSSVDQGMAEKALVIGGCYTISTEANPPLCDPSLVARSFDGLDTEKLMSNYSYPAETSPVIGVAANYLAGNPINVLSRYVYWQLTEGNRKDARWGLDLFEELIARGDFQDSFSEKAASYREVFEALNE
jgi:hypothetical protein